MPGPSQPCQVVPEVRELLPEVPAAPPLDSEQARFRLYDSFCAFLGLNDLLVRAFAESGEPQ